MQFDYDMDLVAGTLTISGSRSQTHAMPPELFAGLERSNIERISFQASRHRAVVHLPGGVRAPVELGGGRPLSELLAGRLVAYLDQNHWTTLSAWQHGGGRVSADNGAAAERLVQLVEDERIVLPVSGGHLVETGPLYGDRRQTLGATVLSVSRGWRMRNPVHIRIEELLGALQTGEPYRVSDVFRLNAEDVLTGPISRPDYSSLPEPMRTLSAELTSAVALYDHLVDPVAVPDEGGRTAAQRWAEDWERVVGLLQEEGASPDYVGKVARARFLADLSQELLIVDQRLGLGQQEIVDRLLAETDPVASLQYLSRARGVLEQMMRNTTQRWEGNHLIDINFLTSAAGYADVVVGERQMIDYLGRCGNVPPGAALAKTLPEGVALLDELLEAA